MSLLITSDVAVKGEIGVFAGELCVGGAVLNGKPPFGLAIWGDDISTECVDGAVEGEQLTFRLWDGHSEACVNPDWIEGDGRYVIDGLGVVKLLTSSVTPVEFGITGIYPNPFNSVLKIDYALPDASDIRLCLYDITGRKIAELISGRQSAGMHNATFDCTELTSGVYIVQLESGMYKSQVKAVLVK